MSVETLAPIATPTEEIEYYYDSHPTEEDLMPESDPHATLVRYLMLILEWLYHEQGWYIAENLGIYQTRDSHEKPMAPDVAVFKGVALSKQERRQLRSWKLAQAERPAPTVVFEIASDETWQNDVEDKPSAYARMGVKEYFFYDPREPKLVATRLRGWLNVDGRCFEQTPDGGGRLWSEELQSYLVPDDAILRLFDAEGSARLTGEEAAREAEDAQHQARVKEQRARRKAEAALESERTARQAEKAARERAEARLRELGIDPDAFDG
jgi:Uma2 family endonuclease